MGMERIPSKKQERLTDRVRFPAADVAAKVFESEFADDLDRPNPEIVREIFNAFLETQVENTHSYSSEKHGVSFIHADLDAATLARKILERRNVDIPEQRKALKTKERQTDEYIFGSFFSPQNPSALFVFFEQGLNRLMLEVPEAIEALKKGESLQTRKIHYVGTPTRDIGHISNEFVESLKEGGAVERFGDLYAEFIGRTESAVPVQKHEVLLRGISMGAGFAIETAKHLLDDGTATQSREEAKKKSIPHLTVRIDTPPGQQEGEASRRKWQVPLGFAADGIKSFFNDATVRASANPFVGSLVKSLMPYLEKQGVREEMSEEDAALKKEAIKRVLNDLYAGIPIPENLRVTEVIGTDDTTMLLPFSEKKRAFRKSVDEQEARHKGSLGERIVSGEGSHRTFGVDMTHAMPNFTHTHWRRFYRAAKTIENFKT